MNSNLKVYDEKMNKSVDILAKDYAAIRAGRANMFCPCIVKSCV